MANSKGRLIDTSLKKLRVKFVSAIMVVVAVLLAISSAAICYASYEQSSSEVFEELEYAISFVDRPSYRGFSRGEDPHGIYRDSDDSTKEAPLELGLSGRHGFTIPIAVYEISENGSLKALSSIGNVYISKDMTDPVAEAIGDAPYGTGTLDTLGLVYAKQRIGNATLVAFADSSAIYSWGQLALVLLVVDGAVLLLMFIISIGLSRWALAPVRKAWEQQRRFISDASHELKTPLAVMAANISILKRHPSETIASQSQWVESSEIEIGGMQRLIDDMLFIASSDEEAVEEGFSRVNLSHVVERELLQFDSLGFEKRVEIESNIMGGITVDGQEGRLERLVRTLLENAFKYVPSGGEISVDLSTSQKGSPVFSVFNTGDPIPEQELEHIFDRFYRVDEARGRKVAGHGLGLSIAKEIAEANGAMLEADSKDNGIVFIVTWM